MLVGRGSQLEIKPLPCRDPPLNGPSPPLRMAEGHTGREKQGRGQITSEGSFQLRVGVRTHCVCYMCVPQWTQPSSNLPPNISVSFSRSSKPQLVFSNSQASSIFLGLVFVWFPVYWACLFSLDAARHRAGSRVPTHRRCTGYVRHFISNTNRQEIG